MVRELTLGYSPCPNDTFIFHAMVHGLVDCHDLGFDVHLADVEWLNQAAHRQKLQISKLSMAAFGQLQDRYALLHSGAALGRGCGPLIVSRPDRDPDQLASPTIAIPGLGTTAYLLMRLYRPHWQQVAPMTFDRIMPDVAAGRYDAGLIIHEGRFTFAQHGLVNRADLGAWWEDQTGWPIPLGGIAIHRSEAADLGRTVGQIIASSIAYAFDHPLASQDYVAANAQEMDPQVIKQHIDLYVNRFSLDLGKEGTAAIEHLLQRARAEGILAPCQAPLFAYEK
jgi:1,4-dihydroxy-6-naphthoate synthase